MNDLLNWISQPWPWYVSGVLIALIMVWILWAGGAFGVSSTLRSICAIGGAGRWSDFFRYDWKSQVWNLFFIVGTSIGGFIASQWLMNDAPLDISIQTQKALTHMGIPFDGVYLPKDIFGINAIWSVRSWIIMILSGFLVGFGTRYAGGCTSGHAISGLSNLQWPSLIAVIGFFIGGLISTFFILPHLIMNYR